VSEERPWTTKEAAAFLSWDEETVKRWARKGRLRGEKLGREWRFVPDDVRALLQPVHVTAQAAIVEAQMNATYTRMMRGRTA
jgi:excisionase family DNA binding protein